jgi:hypothetical protein
VASNQICEGFWNGLWFGTKIANRIAKKISFKWLFFISFQARLWAQNCDFRDLEKRALASLFPGRNGARIDLKNLRAAGNFSESQRVRAGHPDLCVELR